MKVLVQVFRLLLSNKGYLGKVDKGLGDDAQEENNNHRDEKGNGYVWIRCVFNFLRWLFHEKTSAENE